MLSQTMQEQERHLQPVAAGPCSRAKHSLRPVSGILNQKSIADISPAMPVKRMSSAGCQTTVDTAAAAGMDPTCQHVQRGTSMHQEGRSGFNAKFTGAPLEGRFGFASEREVALPNPALELRLLAGPSILVGPSWSMALSGGACFALAAGLLEVMEAPDVLERIGAWPF